MSEPEPDPEPEWVSTDDSSFKEEPVDDDVDDDEEEEEGVLRIDLDGDSGRVMIADPLVSDNLEEEDEDEEMEELFFGEKPRLDKLPRPVKELNCRMARCYLVKLLRVANGGMNPAYGNPEKRPPFWPQYYWPWEKITDVHTRPRELKEPLQYSEMMKLAIERGYRHFGYDPHTYVDRNVDLSERQGPVVAPPPAPGELAAAGGAPGAPVAAGSSGRATHRAQQQGQPPLLPRPASKLNCVLARTTLCKLLRWQQGGNNPVYGSPDTQPPWWPEECIRWCDVVDLRGKPPYLPDQKSYTDVLKMAVVNAIRYYGFDPETYYHAEEWNSSSANRSSSSGAAAEAHHDPPTGAASLQTPPAVGRGDNITKAPPRLPCPIKSMNCSTIRICLSKLLWFYNKNNPPLYGNLCSMPAWWPGHLMDWTKLKNLRHKYEGPLGNTYTNCLRTALVRGYSFYGVDPENYLEPAGRLPQTPFDSNLVSLLPLSPLPRSEVMAASEQPQQPQQPEQQQALKARKPPPPPLLPLSAVSQEVLKAAALEAERQEKATSEAKRQERALGPVSNGEEAAEFSQERPESVNSGRIEVKIEIDGKTKAVEVSSQPLEEEEEEEKCRDEREEEPTFPREMVQDRDWFPPPVNPGKGTAARADREVLAMMRRCKVVADQSAVRLGLDSVPAPGQIVLKGGLGSAAAPDVYRADLLSAGEQGGSHTDVRLVPGAGGKPVPAHRAVLAAQSTKMRTMLEEVDFRVGMDAAASVVVFPDLEEAVLSKLVGAMYDGQAQVGREELRAFMDGLRLFQQYGMLEGLMFHTRERGGGGGGGETPAGQENEGGYDAAKEQDEEPGEVDGDDKVARVDVGEDRIIKLEIEQFEDCGEIIQDAQQLESKDGEQSTDQVESPTVATHQSPARGRRSLRNARQNLQQQQEEKERTPEESAQQKLQSPVRKQPRKQQQHQQEKEDPQPHQQQRKRQQRQQPHQKKEQEQQQQKQQHQVRKRSSRSSENDPPKADPSPSSSCPPPPQPPPPPSKLRRTMRKADHHLHHHQGKPVIPEEATEDGLEEAAARGQRDLAHWLLAHGMLPEPGDCPACGAGLTLVEDASASDGLSWTCPNGVVVGAKGKKHAHAHAQHARGVDLRRGSVYERDRERSLLWVTRIALCWRDNAGLGQCQEETGVHVDEIFQWYDHCTKHFASS